MTRRGGLRARHDLTVHEKARGSSSRPATGPGRAPRLVYDPRRAERDACGVGFIASLTGDDSRVLELALGALCRLAHRGARSSDDATGDGAGLLTPIPHPLFAAEVERLTGLSPAPGEVGVGVVFLPKEAGAQARCRALLEEAVAAEGLRLFGWRPVPVDEGAIGRYARETAPRIEHLLVGRPAGDDARAFELRLYRARRRAEARAQAEGLDLYVASFSARTIVYKGLFMAHQVAAFYADLRDPRFRVRLAVYHQRYSTNTTPSWRRAQPFRFLAHNGEINTLQGNVNWMKAREAALQAPGLASEHLRGVIDPEGSDSAMLDNALELLALSGRDLPHALMMLIPEAWEGIADMDPARKDFYRFHSALMEPWDGPAAVAFTDGRLVGATLDRNGLRPMRYTLTAGGLVVAGSEVGVVPLEPEEIVKTGKLGPGQMIVVDTEAGRVLENADIKAEVVRRQPYGLWVAGQMVRLADADRYQGKVPAGGNGHGALAAASAGAHVEVGGNGATAQHSAGLPAGGNGPVPLEADAQRLLQQQVAFGYSAEEIVLIIRPMVENAKEPTGSMGDDIPLAVLSQKHRPLFHYFKQRFAEVTNPPIDHLRERLVFSLRTLLGPRGNLLEERPEQAHLIELDSPVLLDKDLERIRLLGQADPAFRTVTLSTLYPVSRGPEGLEAAVAELCARAEAAVDEGAGILILSDRGVDEEHAFIPSLLATGAVHHHLIRAGKRMRVSLVVESGEPREIHHVAALLGYGASAVNPYLALASARSEANEGRLRKLGLTPADCEKRYKKAVEEGLLKVMSKMGISTIDAYTGAQIFEAVGLDQELIDRCFTGTPSVVQGDTYPHLAVDVLAWHHEAFVAKVEDLPNHGYYKPKPKSGGEFHDFTPEAAKVLHRAVRLGSVFDGDWTKSYEDYRRWVQIVRAFPGQLRDLLEIKSDRAPIPIDEVEPVEAIVRRFSTGHMSLGALSPEAHITLAIAMNRLGAKSGSGEGGEDEARYGTEGNSAIKQVASGRFGVTPAYLASALELQIKIAQGSKPGEGGQIPGHKVTDLIARLRHTVPGVALISPPPHHDIYSIEDLAQLIYDLKQANPEAEVSVKLVSETGVGIIAAGVVKGYADIVLISGCSGGTGSSPLNSIKNAGLPWEIGLAETRQALLANGLRERVAVRVDGGFRTGWDVITAALLGADEYSWGTAAMIAEGCVMARVCHTNNCPVGVATQRPELREKFAGKPENVMAYFRFIAQEVREILASMGYRSLDEVIGRTDLLRQKRSGIEAADRLDLSPLLADPPGTEGQPRRRMWRRNPLPPEERIDQRLIELCREAIEGRRAVEVELPIANTDRTVGATLAYHIAKRYGDKGLPPGSIQVRFRGTAGQSFGAFNINGVHFTLIGQANDYVGKGMAGGEIVLRPDPRVRYAPHENVICGNTVLYGATGGEFYAAGRAGERFAVRNSGALAVVEGVGDHGCEYMTGGLVVVLGPTGYNFGAGMTGGEAYVLDEDGRFASRYNPQLVTIGPLSFEDQRRLRKILIKHFERTGSQKAQELLRNWEEAVGRFVRVAPISEVQAITSAEEGAVAR